MKTTANPITIGAAALTLFLFADHRIAAADTVVEPSPIGQLVNGLNPMNWRMPQWKMPNFKQLLPGTDEQTRIKKKKDGLFDEVSKTASNSWNKTKQVLNPQKLNPINYFPASARTPSPRKPVQTEPGFFRSLFTPRAAPEKDNSTVTDFLRQSRPSP